MHPFVAGFGDELVKMAADHGPSGTDVALYEALGPIAAAAKGYKHGGIKGALKGGAVSVAGGGLGAGLGLLAAHGLKKLTGHDIGAGPVRASTVLPALGALGGAMKAERMFGHHKTAKVLTTQGRKHIAKKNFALPRSEGKAGKGSYPIQDEAHARNALARVAQHGSAEEQARVRAKVHAKYPGIGEK